MGQRQEDTFSINCVSYNRVDWSAAGGHALYKLCVLLVSVAGGHMFYNLCVLERGDVANLRTSDCQESHAWSITHVASRSRVCCAEARFCDVSSFIDVQHHHLI